MMKAMKSMMAGLLACSLLLQGTLFAQRQWQKEQIYQGAGCATAVAGDFTGDGKLDVMCSAGGKTRLLVAPSFNLKGARIARISLTLPGLWLAMITRWPLSNANEWLLAEG